jgi:hypothetical protein
MAWLSQTLAAAFPKDAITLQVVDATGFPPVGVSGLQNWRARIDGEWMLIDGQPSAKVIQVKRRGDQGTTAVAHDIAASIVFSGSPLDQVALAPGASTFPTLGAPTTRTIGGDLTLSADAVASIGQNTAFLLHKLTPAAITLAKPTFAQNGLALTFTSAAGVAHVITSAGGGFGTGVTGSPASTATFGAFTGASFTVVAAGGLWNVMSNNGVTFS